MSVRGPRIARVVACTRKEFREEVRHAALVLKRKGVNVYNDTDGKERLRALLNKGA
jgi:hypothetical protein